MAKNQDFTVQSNRAKAGVQKSDRPSTPSKGDRTFPSETAIASHPPQITTSSGVAGETVTGSISDRLTPV